MEVFLWGVLDVDGFVVGVLLGDKFIDGNVYFMIKILSGMQFVCNYIIGLSCYGVIVVGGLSGVYEEVCCVWEGCGFVVVLVNSGLLMGVFV